MPGQIQPDPPLQNQQTEERNTEVQPESSRKKWKANKESNTYGMDEDEIEALEEALQNVMQVWLDDFG